MPQTGTYKYNINKISYFYYIHFLNTCTNFAKKKINCTDQLLKFSLCNLSTDVTFSLICKMIKDFPKCTQVWTKESSLNNKALGWENRLI